jgi:hypothetical protein
MTMIRNRTTGEIIAGGGRAVATQAPKFLLLETVEGARRRGEHLVSVDSIRFIERSPDGYHMHVDGRSEPLILLPHEYDRLIATFRDSGLLAFAAPGTEGW